MPVDPNSLPHDPAILRQMLVDVTTQLDKTQRLLRQLMEAKSCTRSEQLSAEQLRLFAQELKVAELTPPEAPTETEKNEDALPPGSASCGSEDQEESRPRGRRRLPPHLKRERIEHDLTAEEKHCTGCHQDLHPIGEESSERYEYIPAQLLVIEDICKKYACACTVKTASKPPQPIEKSAAGASLLAQVIVSKIPALGFTQRCHRPIVDHQNIDSAKPRPRTSEAPQKPDGESTREPPQKKFTGSPTRLFNTRPLCTRAVSTS